MKAIIVRRDVLDFSVKTDVALSDGSNLSDGSMRFVGNSLRSFERPGDVRVGGLLRLDLGPELAARVRMLPLGGSLEAAGEKLAAWGGRS